jgi:hypothetical protein
MYSSQSPAPAPLLAPARLQQHLCHLGVFLNHGVPQMGMAVRVDAVDVLVLVDAVEVGHEQLRYVLMAIVRCPVERKVLVLVDAVDSRSLSSTSCSTRALVAATPPNPLPLDAQIAFELRRQVGFKVASFGTLTDLILGNPP